MADKNIKIKIGVDSADASRGLGNVRDGMERFRRSAVDLQSPLTNLAGGLAALGLTAVTKNLVDSALAAERLERQFTAAAGSVVTATRNFATVKQLANDLGLEFQSTAGAYAKFMAATRGTAIEGAQADKVFRGVSEAVAAMGLTSDEAGGIFLALSQMMSKGKVSAEELTGQLGERLPGALKLAADGMGMTTAELLQQMQQGKIMSADLLPKLAEEMHKTYGQAATEGAQSATAAMNRFRNEIYETSAAIGDYLLPAVNSLATVGAGAMSEFRRQLQEFEKDNWADKFWRIASAINSAASPFSNLPVESFRENDARAIAARKANAEKNTRMMSYLTTSPVADPLLSMVEAQKRESKIGIQPKSTGGGTTPPKPSRVRSGSRVTPATSTPSSFFSSAWDNATAALEFEAAMAAAVNPTTLSYRTEANKPRQSLMGGFGGFQSLERQEEARAKKDLADQSITQLQEQLQTEEERVRESYAARLKMVEDYATEYGMAEEKRAELVNKIQAQQAEYEKQQQMANFTSTLGIIEGQISQFTGLLDQQSKSQFYAWKAFAIAQATISTALAVANILAAESKLGVAAIPLAFGAGAIGAAQIGVIANTEYVAQRELGGPVAGGTPYIVGEKGPELFLPAVNGSIIPNNRLSGGGVAVTNVFQISTGVSDTVRAELMSMMPVIESRSINAVHSAIESGGPLAKAVGR